MSNKKAKAGKISYEQKMSVIASKIRRGDQAIISAKIDIGSQPGRAFWSNGGGLIGIIAPNRQALDYLTELALTNTEEGRTFQKQLKETMK